MPGSCCRQRVSRQAWTTLKKGNALPAEGTPPYLLRDPWVTQAMLSGVSCIPLQPHGRLGWDNRVPGRIQSQDGQTQTLLVDTN